MNPYFLARCDSNSLSLLYVPLHLGDETEDQALFFQRVKMSLWRAESLYGQDKTAGKLPLLLHGLEQSGLRKPPGDNQNQTENENIIGCLNPAVISRKVSSARGRWLTEPWSYLIPR